MEFPYVEQDSDVAVSIVTYNNDPQELLTLLGSLQTPTVTLSITVVDNSESDRLRSVVEGAGALYLYVGMNLGFGAAHNIALRRNLQRAPYQLVVNPDISMAASVIPSLCEFMDSHPEVGQVMPAVRHLDGSEQRLAKRLPSPADLFLRRFLPVAQGLFAGTWRRYEMRDVDLSAPCEVPSLSGCFMFLRSSALEAAGLFDERFFMYMEDVDLCRRIGAVSQTVFFPGCSVIHGYSKGSYRNARLFRLHLSSAIRYFNKWGWLFDRDRRVRNRRTGQPTPHALSEERLNPDLEVNPL